MIELQVGDKVIFQAQKPLNPEIRKAATEALTTFGLDSLILEEGLLEIVAVQRKGEQ